MTFIQPFASPEVDLEGMRLSTFICLLLLVPSNSCFSPPFTFPLVLFSRFPMHPLSLCVFSASLIYTAEGSKCKSRGTIFFSRALISADDISKEVKGTTQRPPQLLSPIHRVQIYVSLSFSLFLPHSHSLSYHIFNIINIDRSVHLEPLFNNWLLRLM